MFSSRLLKKYPLPKTHALPTFYKSSIAEWDYDNPKQSELRVVITYTNENKDIAESICYPKTGQISSLKIFHEENRGKGLGKELLKDTILEMQHHNYDLNKVWTICINKVFWENVFNKSFKIKNPAHETVDREGYSMAIETGRNIDEWNFKKEELKGKILCGVALMVIMPVGMLYATFVELPIWIRRFFKK